MILLSDLVFFVLLLTYAYSGGFAQSCAACMPIDNHARLQCRCPDARGKIRTTDIEICEFSLTPSLFKKILGTDYPASRFQARYIHNWFGYLSCFGIRNPDLTPRVYDCKPEGWQPAPDSDDLTCTEPCDDDWESPETTVSVPATKRAIADVPTLTGQSMTTVTTSAN